VKDKYVVIDTKNRGKHKHVTTISGLGIYGIDVKDFGKKCSKKFACSCSAIEEGVAQIQGEFFEEIKEILIMEYKVKKKYIIDGEEYKVKFNEEMAKKKEEKKLKGKEIQEVDEKEEEDHEMKEKEEKEKEEESKEGQPGPVIEEKPKNRLGFEIRSDSEDDD
jgi:translation initiation factor 1 (eIF-1/SUI1)